MGLHYKIELVPDNMYGVLNHNLIEAAMKATIFAIISVTNKRAWRINAANYACIGAPNSLATCSYAVVFCSLVDVVLPQIT
uniref:Uncharacterized protein n=1 Tax=Glossina palpalis gambiensis TaxID=67801 RepID=A0A1B0C338_9MUSC